jgi:serralysin
MPVTGKGTLLRGLGGAVDLGEMAIARSDDGSVRIDASSLFDGGITWFGTAYDASEIYINSNGSVSFGEAVVGLPDFGNLPPAYDMIGAFWGDVDTRLNGEGVESGQIWANMDTTTNTLSVTWDDVGVYRRDASLTNSFQIQITNQGAGNVDVTLRYDTIDWTIGTADTDLGARAFLGGQRLPKTLDIGGDPALLDTNLGNTGAAGLWFFEMRDGALS